MAFLNGENRRLLTAVSKLLFSNPFLPEILVYEQEALGEGAVEGRADMDHGVSDPEWARAKHLACYGAA